MTMVFYSTKANNRCSTSRSGLHLQEATWSCHRKTKKHIPYPCIHFKHLADELVSETTKRRRMQILVGARNIILLEHNRNNQ
jgi:hypothetical protein